MKNRIFLFLTLLLLSSNYIIAQYTYGYANYSNETKKSNLSYSNEIQTKNILEKLTFGGGISTSFGNNDYFHINISPSLGYIIDYKLEVGGVVGYNYYRNKYYNQSFFNIGPYANYSITNNIFLRANYMYYYGKIKLNNYNSSLVYNGNINESALWLGGGYETGNSLRLRVGMLYNVLYKKDRSIFSSGFEPFVGVSIYL